jgi:OpgC protein
VFFIAYIAQTAEHYDNPMLAHEFNIFNFLRHPDVMLLQGLMLKFKPVDPRRAAALYQCCCLPRRLPVVDRTPPKFEDDVHYLSHI